MTIAFEILFIKFSLVNNFFAKKGLKIYAIIDNIDRIAAKFIFLYFIQLSYHNFTEMV